MGAGPVVSEGMPPKITDENVETPREISIQRAIMVVDEAFEAGRQDDTNELNFEEEKEEPVFQLADEVADQNAEESEQEEGDI